MTPSFRLLPSACALGLMLLPVSTRAQGVIDRLLGDDPGRSVAPADLVAAGVWVYDPVQGLGAVGPVYRRSAGGGEVMLRCPGGP